MSLLILWFRYVRNLWILNHSHNGQTRKKLLNMMVKRWKTCSDGLSHCRIHNLTFDSMKGTCRECLETFR